MLLVLAAISLAGCATTNPISTPPYYPSNPSAVLLTYQGEIEAIGSVSTGGETFMGAYALTPHLGLLADGSLALHKTGDPNGNQYSGDIGVGYFDTATKGHIVHEVYGAVGWGSAHDNAVIDDGDLFNNFLETVTNEESVHFWNAWIQGAMGYSRENFSFMILTRLSYVNTYHDVNMESFSGLFETPSHYDTTFVRSSYLLLLTPGLEARFGFEHVKLIASISEMLPGSLSKADNPYFLASLGICYNF